MTKFKYIVFIFSLFLSIKTTAQLKDKYSRKDSLETYKDYIYYNKIFGPYFNVNKNERIVYDTLAKKFGLYSIVKKTYILEPIYDRILNQFEDLFVFNISTNKGDSSNIFSNKTQSCLLKKKYNNVRFILDSDKIFGKIIILTTGGFKSKILDLEEKEFLKVDPDSFFYRFFNEYVLEFNNSTVTILNLKTNKSITNKFNPQWEPSLFQIQYSKKNISKSLEFLEKIILDSTMVDLYLNNEGFNFHKKGYFSLNSLEKSSIIYDEVRQFDFDGSPFLLLKKEGVTQLMNYKGEVVLEGPGLTFHDSNYKGCIKYMKDNKVGAIFQKYKYFIIPPVYKKIEILDWWNISFQDNNQKWGIANLDNKILLSAMYDKIETPFGSRAAKIYKDGKIGFCQYLEGNKFFVVEPQFDKVFHSFQNNFYYCSKGLFKRFYDYEGNVIADEVMSYDEVKSCSYQIKETYPHFISFLRKNETVLLHKETNQQKSIVEEVISQGFNDDFFVKMNGKFGVKNWAGKIKIPIKFDTIICLAPLGKHLLYKAKNKAGWEVFDHEGKSVFFTERSDLKHVNNAIAIFTDNKYGIFSLIDNKLSKVKFDWVSNAVGDSLLVKINQEYFTYNFRKNTFARTIKLDLFFDKEEILNSLSNIINNGINTNEFIDKLYQFSSKPQTPNILQKSTTTLATYNKITKKIKDCNSSATDISFLKNDSKTFSKDFNYQYQYLMVNFNIGKENCTLDLGWVLDHGYYIANTEPKFNCQYK